MASGQLMHRFSQHRETVTSCAWMPCSRRFLSGSIDKTILMFDTNGGAVFHVYVGSSIYPSTKAPWHPPLPPGNELQRYKRPYRIQDLAVTHDGSFLIMASSERQLHVLR